MQRIKEDEIKKLEKNKTRNTKRRLSFQANDTMQNSLECDQIQNANLNENKKCYKCKNYFTTDIFNCENNSCKKWICKKDLPKKFEIGNEFYCCKKCRPVA